MSWLTCQQKQQSILGLGGQILTVNLKSLINISSPLPVAVYNNCNKFRWRRVKHFTFFLGGLWIVRGRQLCLFSVKHLPQCRFRDSHSTQEAHVYLSMCFRLSANPPFQHSSFPFDLHVMNLRKHCLITQCLLYCTNTNIVCFIDKKVNFELFSFLKYRQDRKYQMHLAAEGGN